MPIFDPDKSTRLCTHGFWTRDAVRGRILCAACEVKRDEMGAFADRCSNCLEPHGSGFANDQPPQRAS